MIRLPASQCFFVAVLICFAVRAEPDALAEVRGREREMAEALKTNDREALVELFAGDFIVNNPANMVLESRDEVMKRVDAGIIRYDRYEQEIKLVRAYGGDTVVVMGEERVRPIGTAPGAGKVLRRQYTNVWRKIDGRWRLQARHANLLPDS